MFGALTVKHPETTISTPTGALPSTPKAQTLAKAQRAHYPNTCKPLQKALQTPTPQESKVPQPYKARNSQNLQTRKPETTKPTNPRPGRIRKPQNPQTPPPPRLAEPETKP